MNKEKRIKNRAVRTRKKLSYDLERPRLSVFRSIKYLYAQVIDDTKAATLVAVSEKELGEKAEKESKTQRAKNLGIVLGKKAVKKKIKSVRFDKGSYKYHGRVKAFADGAREGGLQF